MRKKWRNNLTTDEKIAHKQQTKNQKKGGIKIGKGNRRERMKKRPKFRNNRKVPEIPHRSSMSLGR